MRTLNEPPSQDHLHATSPTLRLRTRSHCRPVHLGGALATWPLAARAGWRPYGVRKGGYGGYRTPGSVAVLWKRTPRALV